MRNRPAALPYFAPIAQTSGFLDLFLGFVSELKRDETWPEQFEMACRQRGWLPRDAELSLLYRRYQDRLNELSLYDAEGRFWSARSVLAEGRRGASTVCRWSSSTDLPISPSRNTRSSSISRLRGPRDHLAAARQPAASAPTCLPSRPPPSKRSIAAAGRR